VAAGPPAEVQAGRFVLGLVLLGLGGGLFLSSVDLLRLLAWDAPLVVVGGLRITAGIVFAVLGFGLVLIYVDPRNVLAWLLAAAGFVSLCAFVYLQLRGRIWQLSPPELVGSLGLILAGAGLFLSSIPLSAHDGSL